MPKKNAARPADSPKSPLPVILKGVLFAYFLSLLAFLLVSAMLQFTRLSEAILPYIAYSTALVTIFAGAAYAAKNLTSKGWLNGGITGLVYLAGVLLFGAILSPGTGLPAGLLTKTVLAFATGAAGGIFGVNA